MIPIKFQRQFDKLAIQKPQPAAKVLTGIEKERAEVERAQRMWDELEKFNQ